MNQQLPDLTELTQAVSKADLPQELKDKASRLINRVSLNIAYQGSFTAVDQITKYIDWIVSLPWNLRTQDVLDLERVKTELDKTHYGLTEIKERVLEYVAVLKLLNVNNQNALTKAPILCFIGLAGTGKTTIAEGIAVSLGRRFVRVPLGGMGSSLELRGQTEALPNSEPGQIIKALRRCQIKNPVILLDEIDRVADTARADVMGVLLELLDPEQNNRFVDNYIDYPFDLSEVLFISTANNTNNISTAVLDRLEPIEMPSYTDSEKMAIGKNYLLQKTMSLMGITQNHLTIDDDVWPIIIRPLGFDSGIRSLERTISGMVRKVAKKIVTGEGTQFHVTTDNLKSFIPTW